VLLGVELVLVLSGQLAWRTAAVVLVVLEAALALVVVGQLAGTIRRYRTARAVGTDREQALQDALRALLPGPVAVLVRQELLTWSSLALLVRGRRHGVQDGAVALPYDAALRPLGLVLVGVSVVELVVLELVVPWPPVRLVLLVLGLWTLLFVLGAVAGSVVRPHVLTDDELLLRVGAWAEARVPLDRVASVAARLRSASGSTVQLLDDGVLVVPVSGTTGVDVVLAGPTALATSRGRLTAGTVRFACDDPAAAVRALRRCVATSKDDHE
jgi:hypothetical protein